MVEGNVLRPAEELASGVVGQERDEVLAGVDVVDAGVAGGGGLAFAGARAGGFLGVPAVGGDPFVRNASECHGGSALEGLGEGRGVLEVTDGFVLSFGVDLDGGAHGGFASGEVKFGAVIELAPTVLDPVGALA